MHLTTCKPLALSALFACVVLLGGCGLRGGQTLVKYERGDTGDILIPAPANGTAGLYSQSDVEPSLNIQVQRGEQVGFRDGRTRDSDGNIVDGNLTAVAGDFERNVSQGAVFDRTYYWKFRENR